MEGSILKIRGRPFSLELLPSGLGILYRPADAVPPETWNAPVIALTMSRMILCRVVRADAVDGQMGRSLSQREICDDLQQP